MIKSRSFITPITPKQGGIRVKKKQSDKLTLSYQGPWLYRYSLLDTGRSRNSLSLVAENQETRKKTDCVYLLLYVGFHRIFCLRFFCCRWQIHSQSSAASLWNQLRWNNTINSASFSISPFLLMYRYQDLKYVKGTGRQWQATAVPYQVFRTWHNCIY